MTNMKNKVVESIKRILVSARLKRDEIAEKEALFWMESLMVSTLQHLACIIEHPSPSSRWK